MPSGPRHESAPWFLIFAASTTPRSPSSYNLLSWASRRGRPCSRPTVRVRRRPSVSALPHAVATPWPVCSPADPRRRPSTWPVLRCAAAPRDPRSSVPQPVRNSPHRRPPRSYNGDGSGSIPIPAKRRHHVLPLRQLRCPPGPGPGQARGQLLRRLPARTCMHHAARRRAESWSTPRGCLCRGRRVLCCAASLMTSM